MSRTIFEISEELLQLNTQLDSLESDDDQREAIDNYLKGIEDELAEKLDHYVSFIAELEARSQVRKTEAERLMHRAKVDANRALRLRECLRWFFFTHRMKTYETARYRITLATNGGKAPVILSVREDQLPSEYVREVITYKADLDAIREKLEQGIPVEGASLGERGASIRIG